MKHTIITIGREFGSGGHKVGQILSDQLGIAYYDKELLTLAIERGEIREEKFAKYDEKKQNNFFYEKNYEGNEKIQRGESMQDTLFTLQTDVMREIANKMDAVFVGRCADYVLREEDICLIRVFIKAPIEQRIRRVMEREGLDEKTARKTILKKDRERKKYYESRTGQTWGDAANFDLYFDTRSVTLNEAADSIAEEYRKSNTSLKISML